MSLEIMREDIRVMGVIGEDSSQSVLENDIIVPDSKPDVSNLLLVDGDIFVDRSEVMQDKVLVYGTIRYKILYVPEEGRGDVGSITANVGFSHSLDIPDARPGMSAGTECEMLHMSADIVNGRKICVKSIIGISGKVIDVKTHQLAADIRGIDDIQLLKDKAVVECYIGEARGGGKISETLEVPTGKPAIREMLKVDAKIAGKDFRLSEGRILIKGNLNISTLYVGDDEERSIQFMEHEVPFSSNLDLDGVDEGSDCEIDCRLETIQLDPGEDSDGELRVMNLEATLDCTARAHDRKSVELLEDAYSPTVGLSLDKESVEVAEKVARSRGQVVLREKLPLEEGPEISELYTIQSRPSLSGFTISDDRVVVEGTVSNDVLYLSNDSRQPVQCFKKEIPFKQSMDIKGIKDGMDCDVAVETDHCNYSMVSANEVEIRIVLAVTVKANKKIVIPVAGKIQELAADERKYEARPGIIIYFTQPGDTLWKIAKKYRINMGDIGRVNELEGGEIIPTGRQIIIPRKR